MGTVAKSGEQRSIQPQLQGLSPFAPSPVDASDAVVTACRSEAEAVRWCLDYAREQHGMSLRAVAKLCGWKSPTFLSEIAEESNPKRMPEKRVRKFTLATGLRLLEQYHDRQRITRALAGAQTDNDRRQWAAQLLREAA